MGGGKGAANTALLEWIRPYDLAHFKSERVFSVSWTSRGERPNESNGVEYWFNKLPVDFLEALESDFLEKVLHPGGYYGTPMPAHGTPTHYEFEVAGYLQSLQNMHPNARQFRESNSAVYIAQQCMSQLLSQIMARPDGMSEEKKIHRAARYPGELKYILEHSLPYKVVENNPGEQDRTNSKVIRAMIGDSDVPLLGRLEISEKIHEACDYLHDEGIEPIFIKEA